MRIAQYTWYDAWWLAAFAEARAVIAKTSPAVLDDFLAAIEPLKTSPTFETRVVDPLLDADELASVRGTIAGLTRADLDLATSRRHGASGA